MSKEDLLKSVDIAMRDQKTNIENTKNQIPIFDMLIEQTNSQLDYYKSQKEDLYKQLSDMEYQLIQLQNTYNYINGQP